MTMLEKRALAPPEIGIPPRTRAMRIWVSSWLPAVPVIEPTFTTLMKAAKPVIAPDTVNTRNFLRSGRQPEKRAAVSPAPIARRSQPSLGKRQAKSPARRAIPVRRSLSQVALRSSTPRLAGTGPFVVMYLQSPRKKYIVQIVTMKEAIRNFTWKKPLKAPIAAPARIPAATPRAMLRPETQQKTMEARPRMEPCEKSRPPTVMIMKTPMDEIIST